MNKVILMGRLVRDPETRYTHLSKGQASDFLLNNMGEKSEYVFIHEHVERN